MKTIRWFGLAAWLVIPVLSGYAQTTQTATSGATGQASTSANLSPGAAEVVQLATSGVSDDVILAYIKNSQAAFNLSADDVLYLKDLGLSPAVTSAMLSHDSTLRGQAQPYAPAAATAPATPVTTAAPAAPVPVATAAPAAPVAAVAAPAYVSNPPAEVAYFYSDLAPYGSWVQLEGYGWCWQPTTVVITPGWRPYCDGGYWVYSDLGWYWQSTYSWGWAPFHYGRWYMHSRCGWVWLPDRVWGPAWVTWRTTGDYCGWAPLPPHAEFDVHMGWRYNGVSVGVGFDFGLGSDAFLFVGFGDFFYHDLHHHCLPPGRVGPIFHQTTIVNNIVVVNGRMEHRGVPVDRFSAAHHGPVPRVTVHDWSDRPGRMPVRAGSVVYRPQLNAPAQPGKMVAQRLDARNPVIQHNPGPAPKNERAGSFNRAGAAPAGGAAPKGSSWSGGARPGTASQGQSAWSPAQSAPAGKARTTSDWSGGSKGASAPQVQSSPGARQTAPAMSTTRAPQAAAPSGSSAQPASQPRSTPSASSSPQTIPSGPAAPRAPQEWKQGAQNGPGYRSDAGLPALYNSRTAGQSAPASTATTGTRFYQPKSQAQAAEVRSLPSTDGRSSGASGGRSTGSPSQSQKNR